MISLIRADGTETKTSKIGYKPSRSKGLYDFCESHKSMLCMIRQVLLLPIFIGVFEMYTRVRELLTLEND